ncbi:MAG TPA: ABC transporter ATP-binding protein, partial [Kiritimatiellia bacterium]|nr:ABC transporter ATP-binding protein [Kiritimatiellia bacterium]
ALDVSIQSQILNLLHDLQKELGLTYVFIAHDLAVIEYISTRVAVMYLGRLAEIGPADSMVAAPKHPYAQALVAAVPVPGMPRRRKALGGEPPSAANPPSGCRFHPRCPRAMPVCRREAPAAREVEGHRVWCHLYPETPG